MSGSSNLNSFRDRKQVAAQLVPCGVLPPGLVQDCSQHSSMDSNKMAGEEARQITLDGLIYR